MDNIIKFIGDEKWENVKVIGIDMDGEEIDTLLSCYDDLDDLSNCMELHPVEELFLVKGNEEFDLFGIW